MNRRIGVLHWMAGALIGWLMAAVSVSATTGCTSFIARVRAELPAPATATPLPMFTARPTNTRWPTATPSPTPTPGMPGAIGGVTTATVNLRLGPGTTYAIVTRVPTGTTVYARGRDIAGAWAWVAVPEAPGTVNPTARGAGGAPGATRSPRAQGWLNASFVAWQRELTDLPVIDAPPPPLPTATVAPTRPPPPTATPRMYVDFRADTTTIPAGGCTTLRWDVEGVTGVYLDGRGQPGHGALEVCTHTTRTFVLHVVPRDGAAFNRSVTVAVMASAAPTPAP